LHTTPAQGDSKRKQTEADFKFGTVEVNGTENRGVTRTPWANFPRHAFPNFPHNNQHAAHTYWWLGKHTASRRVENYKKTVITRIFN
jgi:hypothetical protein